jgi:predicted Rossmann fold nucleotide-binding protein DprA/Smf involved in DNA uptake
MVIGDDARRLLVLCAIRIDGKSLDWSLLARVAQAGGLEQLYAGIVPEHGAAAARSLPLLRAGLADLHDAETRVAHELEAAAPHGANLVTVLDEAYPASLRLVPDLPPFLFIRGQLQPAENRELAERITGNGALISQFWPTRAPGRDTFPRRNRVTSGISQGTVVIEASSTSGAKMQARLASEHGKHVWLITSLVQSQDWARRMVTDDRAREVSSTAAVLEDLVEPSAVSRQVTDERRNAAAGQMTLDLG